MTAVPATLLAAMTVSQYKSRSDSTRHAPAEITSQCEKLSSAAICASALSASSSKSVEYLVAEMTPDRAVNMGWNVQNASNTSSGDSASVPGMAIIGKCCSQYQSQISDRFIPLPHPVVGASDGEGRPAPAQAIPRLSGRVLARVRRAVTALFRPHSLLDDGPLGWMLGGASIFLTAIGCQILLETLCGGL